MSLGRGTTLLNLRAIHEDAIAALHTEELIAAASSANERAAINRFSAAAHGC